MSRVSSLAVAAACDPVCWLTEPPSMACLSGVVARQAHELYFSTSHDVTLSAQRRATLDFRHSRLPMWKRADDRFFWNKNLLAPLARRLWAAASSVPACSVASQSVVLS